MPSEKRKIALLGATGSIGSSTLDVIAEQGQSFDLQIISAHNGSEALITIANRFSVPILVLTGSFDRASQEYLRSQVPNSRVYFGVDELIHVLLNEEYDIGLNAISGSAGLRSSLAILQGGKGLALANKESLVMAGHIIKRDFPGALILPVDSEHSAIFQCLKSGKAEEVAAIIITASGGALRHIPLEQLSQIKIGDALKHPNWDMGTKVTLDSATMFNKALEVIEAHWLFGLEYERIRAIIHPQSLIHSMVEYVDGSIIAQISNPDMRLPILYALSYPQRKRSQLVKTDFYTIGEMSFGAIEALRYPLFYLGVECGKSGGLYPTVVNAANEAALHLFAEDKIGYPDIFRIVEKAVQDTVNISYPSVEEIIETNTQVYHSVLSSSF